MPNEEIMNAIKTAIQLEKDGEKFFKEAANNTNNEQGKQMFRQLALDEARHLKVFQEMFEGLTGDLKWGELLRDTKGAVKVPIFKEEELKKSKDRGTTADIEALRLALDAEREAISFFGKVADSVDDEKAKEVFKRIQKEEEFHYALIQAEIDHIHNSGFWFDMADFKLDGLA